MLRQAYDALFAKTLAVVERDVVPDSVRLCLGTLQRGNGPHPHLDPSAMSGMLAPAGGTGATK